MSTAGWFDSSSNGGQEMSRSPNDKRPSREKTFLDVAAVLALQGTCSRAQVGCVIVVAGRIVATGWNGALPGARHCDHSMQVTEEGKIQGEVDRLVEGDTEFGHCSNAIHAEMNAIAQAASSGVSIAGATAYTTHAPCRPCYQMLRASGVELVVYRAAYRVHPLVATSVHVRSERT